MSPGAEWRIAVDTGGTFTDCLGVDPQGRRLRAKLLSSGTLRMALGRRPSGREVVLAGSGDFVDGFFAGWTASLGGECAEVIGSVGRRLELQEAVTDAALASESEVVLQSPEEAAVVAIRWITGTPPGARLPPVALRLATTRGTNALLERKGAPVALFVTRGFGDLVRIGNQQRPDLFALEIKRPKPICASVVEVQERLDASGGVLETFDETSLVSSAERLVSLGLRSAAIAFLHSYRNPEHEDRAADLLLAAGFRNVSRSSALSRRIRIVPRAQTALADAYLAEIIETYLEGVQGQLEPRSLHVMTSAGGLVRASDYRAKDSLLSGPAAGVVGAVAAGKRTGEDRILAFDMGGTSTDVSRFDGDFELRSETAVGGIRLLSPSVAVETVAAGGGSICRYRDQRAQVGPESAGSHPGPACYGGGGPLTLTDVNLLLGRLVPSRFPFRVDRAAAAAKARAVEEAIGGFHQEWDGFLFGFLAIANERMAGAIRAISIRRGYDPATYTLVAFGGAGAQHAAAVAELLGISRVLIPADGALLSAVGLNEGRLERWAERQVISPLPSVAGRLPAMFADLASEAGAELLAEGVTEEAIEAGSSSIFLRYQGQESTIELAWSADEGSLDELAAAFEKAYVARYGYVSGDRTLEVESLRLALYAEAGASSTNHLAVSRGGLDRDASSASAAEEVLPIAESAQPFWQGRNWVEVPVLERAELSCGERVDGPCLIVEDHTVTVVEAGWGARSDRTGGLLLERDL